MMITKSDATDRSAILALFQSAKRENLTPEARALQGFVQGLMNEERLTDMQNGLGVFVAKEENAIVAVACTSRLGALHQGPIVEAVRVVLEKCKDLSAASLFAYGPVVVAPEWKGKGLLTKLLIYICVELGKQFKNGIAFVEEENQLSLKIHRHYFGKELTTFLFFDRLYYLFLFDTATFLQKYPQVTI